jgi:hypothetical protein
MAKFKEDVLEAREPRARLLNVSSCVSPARSAANRADSSRALPSSTSAYWLVESRRTACSSSTTASSGLPEER